MEGGKKQAVDGVREKEFGGQYNREKINLFLSYGTASVFE